MVPSLHFGATQELLLALQDRPMGQPQLFGAPHLSTSWPLSQYIGFVEEHCPFGVPSEQSDSVIWIIFERLVV